MEAEWGAETFGAGRGLGVFSGATQEEVGRDSKVERGPFARRGATGAEVVEGGKNDEVDGPDPARGWVLASKVGQEPLEPGDQVARVGKAGILLAQPGEHLANGLEDRRNSFSANGLSAGGGATSELIPPVAHGKDQKEVNLFLVGEGLEHGSNAEAVAEAGPFGPGCGLVLLGGHNDSLGTQVVCRAEISCEAISGGRVDKRQGAVWGKAELKWDKSCESVRSQRREAASAMAFAVPLMKETSW